VLAWRLSNTIDAAFCVEALEEALARWGRPEIFNTDQGSQFTGAAFTGTLAGQRQITLRKVDGWQSVHVAPCRRGHILPHEPVTYRMEMSTTGNFHDLSAKQSCGAIHWSWWHGSSTSRRRLSEWRDRALLGFFDVSSGLEEISQGCCNQVDHGREGWTGGWPTRSNKGRLWRLVQPATMGVRLSRPRNPVTSTSNVEEALLATEAALKERNSDDLIEPLRQNLCQTTRG
jgi:hypothetical protein